MNSPPDDSTLMLRYIDGDVLAFETLYRRHNDALYRYLLRLCRRQDTAEDIYQEVWSNIIRTRHRYRPSAKFKTFLYRVAHNCFIDNLRRNKRYSDNGDVSPELADDESGRPDALLEIGMARKKLLAALADLPADQRDTFLLYEEAGLDLEAIAYVTGTNRETVKSRLRYATRKLKDSMDSGGATVAPGR